MITVALSNGQVRSVSGGIISIPRTGIWLADFVMSDQEIPSGLLVLDLAGVSMPASIVKAELNNGMIDLRIVGGAGGLGNTAKPKHYYRPVVKNVLDDLLRDSGEKLSSSCTPSVTGASLEAWTTLGLPTGAMLSGLCRLCGVDSTWRVLSDGTVWLGAEEWPISTVDVRIESSSGNASSAVIGTDTPCVWPGTILGGRKIDLVVHDLDMNRTSVMFAEVS
jgi:hypothetical protein